MLKDGASLWCGCILRGDNKEIRIGHGSNVQQAVICHMGVGYPRIIGANCTIAHNAMLHGCIIGERSLIRMGALITQGDETGYSCELQAISPMLADRPADGHAGRWPCG